MQPVLRRTFVPLSYQLKPKKLIFFNVLRIDMTVVKYQLFFYFLYFGRSHRTFLLTPAFQGRSVTREDLFVENGAPVIQGRDVLHRKVGEKSSQVCRSHVSQWLLAYCYGQLPGTTEISNIGLGLYLDG